MRFPEELRAELLRVEWQHDGRFRAHLMQQRDAVDRTLQPPNGPEALGNLPEFVRFVDSWSAVEREHPGWVVTESRKLQVLDERCVPVRLHLPSIVDLAAFLGPVATVRLRRVMSILRAFEVIDPALRPAATRQIVRLERLRDDQVAALARAVAQLKPGLGRGLYLRSLPLAGIDTKFVERNLTLIELLMDSWHDGAVSDANGLLAWLGCLTKGADRLLIRPLCEDTRRGFSGLGRLWVESEELAAMTPPGNRLLVVENETSVFELPRIPGCVAVGGGGGNLAWMAADWIQRRPVGYWGDIDTWGLAWLASAQRKAPHLSPLLMDVATFERHAAAVVQEPDPCDVPDSYLAMEQIRVRDALCTGPLAPARLEQERLDREWVARNLRSWWSPD